MSRFALPDDTDTRLTAVMVLGAVLLLVVIGRAFHDVPAAG